MDYMIADTHFYDENIIRFENRPFKDVEEMNNILVENWNKVVNVNDTVFVLGDFAKLSFDHYGLVPTSIENKLCKILDHLNGKKVLIKGNHDTASTETYLRCGFEDVSSFPIIYNDFWILSHEPMYINKNIPYVNIFGHVHGSPIYKTCSGFHYCVSAERLDYIPLSLDKIKDIVCNKEEKQNE